MQLFSNSVAGSAYYVQYGYYCFIKDDTPHVLIYGGGYSYRNSPWYSRGYFIDLFSSTATYVGESSGSGYYTDGEALLRQQYGLSEGDYEIVDPEDLIDWIQSAYIKLNSYPVFGDATKINYTDGTYEVLDGVLTEQEAKDHAYEKLLQTYGSFYKANEVEINQSLNKMSS